MFSTIEISGYKCMIAGSGSSATVAYMIYPEVAAFKSEWVQKQAELYDVTVVVVYIPSDKWDNVLTPWSAPGVPKGCPPFGGDAEKFCQLLTATIMPKAEAAVGLTAVTERNLIGVSLSGLFTLWQWMQFPTFRNIACLSGSFWYEGFLQWFEARSIPAKDGKAFFLIGDEEPKAKVKAFQSVGTNTLQIVERLKSAGIECRFDWVPGNHFANPLPRAEKAFEYIFAK